MNPSERFDAALAACCASEEEAPTIAGRTVRDMMVAVLGEMDDDDLESICESVPNAYRAYRGWTDDSEVALLCVWTCGVKLGKQLGIAEGAEMPSLFASTEEER